MGGSRGLLSFNLLFHFSPAMCLLHLLFFPCKVSQSDAMVTQLTHSSPDAMWKQPKGRNVRFAEPPWVTTAKAMLQPLLWYKHSSARR